MKKTLAIVLALMMLVVAIPVGAADTGKDNDISFGELTGKEEVVLESIAVTTLPTKLTYQIGENLDVTGGKITLTYSDTTTEEKDITADMVSGFDSATAGAKTLTVTYEDKTAEYAVTVEEPVVLSGIEITTLPKETYQPGEELDVNGGKITLTYSDNSTKEIDMTLDMVSGYDKTKVGPQNLTVSYESQTANYNVIVTEFKLNAVSLKLESSLTFVYKTNVSYYADSLYENPYIEFDFMGKKSVVSEYTLEKKSGSPDRYVFEFKGVAANMMTDDVTATLHATYNGKDYAAPVQITRSAAQLAYGRLTALASNTTAAGIAERTLAADLLNYGAAAQVFTKYKTDTLANADMTEQQKAWATATTPDMKNYQESKYATVDNPQAAWKTVALVLQSAITFKFKFQADNISGMSVKVTADGKTWDIPASDFELVEGTTNQYNFTFSGLYSNQMRSLAYFTVYKDGVAVSNTVQYSIETYACSKNEKNPGTDEANLCIAMMKYGDAAKAFAG